MDVGGLWLLECSLACVTEAVRVFLAVRHFDHPVHPTKHRMGKHVSRRCVLLDERGIIPQLGPYAQWFENAALLHGLLVHVLGRYDHGETLLQLA